MGGERTEWMGERKPAGVTEVRRRCVTWNSKGVEGGGRDGKEGVAAVFSNYVCISREEEAERRQTHRQFVVPHVVTLMGTSDAQTSVMRTLPGN